MVKPYTSSVQGGNMNIDLKSEKYLLKVADTSLQKSYNFISRFKQLISNQTTAYWNMNLFNDALSNNTEA